MESKRIFFVAQVVSLDDFKKHQISPGGTHSEGSHPHGNWDAYGSKPSATARPGGNKWKIKGRGGGQPL